MRTHDLNGPSSLKRRKLCPGSHAVESLYPEEEGGSTAAQEGSRKHALLEDLILGKASLDDVWDDDVLWCYATLQDQILPRGDHRAVFHAELRLDLSSLGISHGTADLVVELPERLILVDWKFGTAFVDAPPWNLQFQALSCGLWDRFGPKPIEAWVLQPNAPNPDYRASPGEFAPDQETALRASIRAIVASTQDPAAPLVPGEHCALCRAAETCPARSAALARLPRHLTVESHLRSLAPQERGAFLDDLKRARAWIEKAIGACEDAGLAGLEFAGYALGRKRGSRRWIDEDDALDHLLVLAAEKGLPAHRVSRPTLISVAEAEKLFRGDLDGRLWEKLPGGPTLVRLAAAPGEES